MLLLQWIQTRRLGGVHMIEEGDKALGGLLDDAVQVQEWDNSWWRKLISAERTIWQMEKNIPQVVDLSSQLR